MGIEQPVGTGYAKVGGEGCPSALIFDLSDPVTVREFNTLLDEDLTASKLPIRMDLVTRPGIRKRINTTGNDVTDCGECGISEICPFRYTIEMLGMSATAVGVKSIPLAAAKEEVRKEQS